MNTLDLIKISKLAIRGYYGYFKTLLANSNQ